MASAQELEQQLTKQQSDYLSRLEKAGQLPTIVSEAWNKAGGEETKALRGEEANLLKDYVSAGAEAREKYKDVWDPFRRDTLASQQKALDYAPIADIRAELAMRAEALAAATQGAVSMYGAETDRAGTAMSFTESAYGRASNRESEVTRQRERQEDATTRQRERQEDAARAKSNSNKSSSDSLEKSITGDLQDIAQNGYQDYKIATGGEEIMNQDDYMTREELINVMYLSYGQKINKDWIADQIYNSYFPG